MQSARAASPDRLGHKIAVAALALRRQRTPSNSSRRPYTVGRIRATMRRAHQAISSRLTSTASAISSWDGVRAFGASLPRATRLPHHQAAPDRGAADSRRAPDRAACGHAGASDSHRHWTAHAKNSPGGLLRLRSARSAGTAGRGPSTEARKDREMSVNVSGAAGARDTYRGASPSTATRIVGPCRPEATRRRARTSVSPTPAWPPGPTPRA